MIRIGCLGASKIAPKAILAPAAARDDCQIITVASRDADRARAYADAHDIPEIESSYEALILRDDIDLIYNALPPHRHAELSILAAQQGKAVLCEKPFAMNAQDAKRMVKAAEMAGTVLMEAFHYRFHPAFLAFAEIVASGRLGTIRQMHGVFNVHITNRAGELRYQKSLGGGALMDLGCYPLHGLRSLIGVEPDILEAEVMRDDASDVDVASFATLQFGEIEATLACDMGPGAIYENYIDVIGDQGVARMTNPVHPYRWNPWRGFEIYTHIGADREVMSLHNSPDSWQRPTYDYQLDHVVSVLKGDVHPQTGGADAVANMAAIDEILAKGDSL